MRLFVLCLALLLLLGTAVPLAHAQGSRSFPQTGFSVDDDLLWDYFQARGGVDTFGYPVSALTSYDGFPVQIFQRHVLQKSGTQARPLNLLDPEVMPINSYGGLTFPAYSEAVARGAPAPDAPDYGSAVQRHIDAAVPNSWQGARVGFHDYFLSAASASSGSLRPLLALEVWGFPTSEPARDPNNNNFIYQRFQRGIMHFDATSGVTRGILLGDAFKERLGGGASAPPPAPPAPPSGTGQASVVGVEILRGAGPRVASKAAEANVHWVRMNGLLWNQVEAARGSRNWATMSALEADIQAVSAQGLTPVVVIHGTPGWAQKVAGASCGPISEAALGDFTSFVREAVARYSGPPYNVKYWEIGNEPDIDARLFNPDAAFGCWGDQSDFYYGGGGYAAMLKQVYPAIKGADPSAQVLLGGLLLDCDPENPPAGQDCQPSRFLEGVLRAGGAPYFDILAYHAYALWNPTTLDADLADPKWQHRGGALLGKLDFLRDTMARYGVSKLIHMNEGGLLCHESYTSCPGDTFYQAQAQYLPKLYARAWANGVQNAVWFTLNGPGWREGGLLNADGSARPAYTALDTFGAFLGAATVERTLSTGNLEGYAFRSGGSHIYLYWSNDGTSRSVALPAGTQGVFDYLGRPLSASGSVSVGTQPVYLRIVP